MDKTAKRQLELFIAKAGKLSNKRFIKHIRDQEGIEHTLTMSDEEGFSSQHTGPDEDAIEAAAALYRLFTEKVNSTSIHRMAALVDNPDISGVWKGEFKRIRTEINAFLDESIPFVMYGEAYTHRYVIDIFLNGGIFHSEPGKVEIYDAWRSDPLDYPEMEFEFIGAMNTVLDAILYLADLCRKELHMKQEGTEQR